MRRKCAYRSDTCSNFLVTSWSRTLGHGVCLFMAFMISSLFHFFLVKILLVFLFIIPSLLINLGNFSFFYDTQLAQEVTTLSFGLLQISSNMRGGVFYPGHHQPTDQVRMCIFYLFFSSLLLLFFHLCSRRENLN